MKRLIATTVALGVASVAVGKMRIAPLPDNPAAATPSASTQPTTKPASKPKVPTTQKVDVLGPGKRVTLSLKGASAKEAFAALEKASGYKLPVNPPNILDNATGNIDLEVKDRPWLEVVTLLAEKAGVTAAAMPQWMITQNFGQRGLAGRMYYVGPIAVGCRALTVDSDIQYGGGSVRRTVFTMNCMLATEPGASSGSPNNSSVVDEVLDEQGKPIQLLPSERSISPELRMYGFPGAFDLSFVVPPGSAKKLSVVRGRVFVDIVSGSADLKIKDVLGNGSTVEVNGWRFGVSKPVAQGGQNMMVELRTPRDDSTNLLLTLQQNGQMHYMPRSDTKGVSVHFMGTMLNGNDIVLRMLVVRQQQAQQGEAGEPGPVDVTWPLPAEIRRVEVPFEFKDLPVPQ